MTQTDSGPAAVQGYSRSQIGLHWLIAALVAVQLVFGETMTGVIAASEEGGPVSAFDLRLAGLHSYVGIAILLLVAMRLALRLKIGAPPEAGGVLGLAGRISHGLFYVLLVAVPVTGLLGYPLGDLFGEVHSPGMPVFLVLIALHVVAALYHQFWRQDGLRSRMLRPQQADAGRLRGWRRRFL